MKRVELRRSGSPIAAVALCTLVLLLVTLLASACGKEDTTTTMVGPDTTIITVTTSRQLDTTTVTTAPSRYPVTVAAQGLAYETRSNGEVRGSVIDFSVEVDKNTTKKVAVGIREGEVSGTGDMWRAAAWTAPLVATSILNLDLADYTIDYEVTGRIDGPSAGALMTIATLAAFMGDQLSSDVTMTGTINPDYTVGPVGGIPHKLEGAAAAGKKTVLVPLGERYDYDMRTEKMVDLVQRGLELGLTVKEVADVYEAYPYFTGKEIPRTTPAGGGTPGISFALEQSLKDCVAGNVRQALDSLAAFEQEAEDSRAANQDYYDAAQAALNLVNKYVSQGSMGAAYGKSQAALDLAAQARLRAIAYGYEDWQDLAIRLRELSLQPDIDSLSSTLISLSPQTIGEASCIMDAWAMLASARLASSGADSALETIATKFADLTEDDLGRYMADAIDQYVYGLVSVSAAEDDLKLAEVCKGPAVAEPERIQQMSEAYRRAAEANLAMLDSTVVPSFASEFGVSEQDAKILMASYDEYYFTAAGATNQMQALLDALPEGPSRDYAVLGTSFLAFSSSAASMAKNYDYIAQYDDNGNITGFVYDKSLTRALDLAREHAESSLLSIEQGPEATVVPWVWYEFANVDREGGPADKISALFNYWNAHVQGRTLLALSGALEPLVDD